MMQSRRGPRNLANASKEQRQKACANGGQSLLVITICAVYRFYSPHWKANQSKTLLRLFPRTALTSFALIDAFGETTKMLISGPILLHNQLDVGARVETNWNYLPSKCSSPIDVVRWSFRKQSVQLALIWTAILATEMFKSNWSIKSSR